MIDEQDIRLEPVLVACATADCEDFGIVKDLLVDASNPCVWCAACESWIISPE